MCDGRCGRGRQAEELKRGILIYTVVCCQSTVVVFSNTHVWCTYRTIGREITKYMVITVYVYGSGQP